MTLPPTDADGQSQQGAARTLLRAAQRLSGLRPYVAEARSPAIDLRLDANEGRPPADRVLSAMQRVSPESLRRYPDATSLEATLAERLGVDASRVVVTNGGDDAIDRVCRAVLEPGRAMLTHTPGFVMIPRSARLAGAEVRTVEWRDGAFPAAAFASMLTEDTGVVALVSPNNPTGGTIDTGTLISLAREAADVGAVVLADLAYVEFADEDPTETLLAEPNVVVIRTLSKAMGLAGARVGYAIAPREIAHWLRTAGAPYPVSAVSLALAGAALDDQHTQVAFVDRIREERAELIKRLQRLGARPIDSQANFVMASFDNAAFVHRGLAALGILVRSFVSAEERSGSLRITLPGDANEFARLCAALKTVLAPRTIMIRVNGSNLADTLETQALRRLADRVQLGLVTSLDADAAETELTTLGIRDCFGSIAADADALETGDSVGTWLVCASDADAALARSSGVLPILMNTEGTTPVRVDRLADLEDFLP